MNLTAEQVYAQTRIDKRNIENRLADVEDDVHIALQKASQILISQKSGLSSCLTVCEINQIIKDYVDALDIYVSEIDQSTLGQLEFIATDPLIPPIIVDLCPHVAYCETDTTLAKVPASLQLSYTAEKHTDLLDLSDWFTAQKVAWSGTTTGRPNTTVQGITDEIVLAIDDTIDCGYFTGGGTPAYTLALDDLSDVNVSGVPLSVGDFLMWDGNNWVPNAGSISFDCSLLDSCILSGTSIFESVNSNTLIRETSGTGQYNRDFLVGSQQKDHDGDTNHYSRMFFDKAKSSFRAGWVNGTYWDNANVGLYSAAFGLNNKANGQHSFSVGSSNTSSDNSAVSLGYGNTSSGIYSFTSNQGNEASSENSHAINKYNKATNIATLATGYNSDAYMKGMQSHAYGKFNTVGDAQSGKIFLRQETTSATTKMLGFAGSTTLSGEVILRENRTYSFEAKITARQTAGSAGTVGDSAYYVVEGVITRDGSNNTILQWSNVDTKYESNAAWAVSVSADDTNESLKIEVTGEADKTIHWTADIKFNEVG